VTYVKLPVRKFVFSHRRELQPLHPPISAVAVAYNGSACKYARYYISKDSQCSRTPSAPGADLRRRPSSITLSVSGSTETMLALRFSLGLGNVCPLATIPLLELENVSSGLVSDDLVTFTKGVGCSISCETSDCRLYTEGPFVGRVWD
jgi:hypothetical protein